MAEAKKQKALAKKQSAPGVSDTAQSSSQPASVTAANVEAAAGTKSLPSTAAGKAGPSFCNHNQRHLWRLGGSRGRPFPLPDFNGSLGWLPLHLQKCRIQLIYS